MPNDPNPRGAPFAELVRMAREQQGLSQDALAELSGVNRSTIIRWESGRAERPHPDQVRAMCQALDVDQLDAATALGYLTEPAGFTDHAPRFGELIRTTREHRGLKQEDLEAASGVRRSTISRWERGMTGRPEPEQVRAVCRALEIDPREAAVALGLLTRDEASGEAVSFPPMVEEALALLQDPAVPDAEKTQWIRYLKYLQERARAARKS